MIIIGDKTVPRPKKTRWVAGHPDIDVYGPLNMQPAGEVSLSVEGLEAFRLSDAEGLDQDTAAKLMGISRQTYGRILSEARATVAHALNAGKILRVAGGNFEVRGHHCRRRRCRGN
jgi:predicted DNA-binding protein (UPF0251 family)